MRKVSISKILFFTWYKLKLLLTPKFYIVLLKSFIALLIVLILLLTTYKFCNNPVSDNIVNWWATKINIHFSNISSEDEKNELNDIVLINIANDKELIPVQERNLPKGEMPITDREKLAKLLSKLQNKHKFVFFDLTFHPSHISHNDSLLHTAFKATERLIVCSSTNNDSIVFPNFNVAHGVSSYRASLETNRFMKYTFTDRGFHKSIALKMAEEVYDKTIIYKKGFYYSNGNLCLNSVILNYKIKPVPKFDDRGNIQIHELGADLLSGEMSDSDLLNLFKNKIILVGDFEDTDLHHTIYGPMPGILINYNAFLALRDNAHVIPISLIIIMTIIFSLFSFIMLFQPDIRIPKKLKKRIRKFINKHKHTYRFIKKIPRVNIIELLFNASMYLIFFGIIAFLIFIIYGIHLDILTMAGSFVIIEASRNFVFKWINNLNLK